MLDLVLVTVRAVGWIGGALVLFTASGVVQ